MNRPRFKLVCQGNFIGGQFQMPADPSGAWTVKSPANFEDVLGSVPYSYADVDRAVGNSAEAFLKWRKLSVAQRSEYLKKYQAALTRRADELCEIISREMGKPLWESRTELTAMTGKVDITTRDSMKLVANYELPNIQPGTLGVCRYRPLGVMAVLGPFNFPGHLPNGHIVPALLTGNTVVFKPSEKTPFVGQIMAECFQEAGLPAGVFNLLQGEREVGRRLAVHEGVSGVLFTGSYEVGMRIKQDTLSQYWKLLALEMGGKNASIVWNDADLNVAIRESLVSAFITTGQRCSATSRILVHRSRLDEFVNELHERAKAFVIGYPLDNPFMGPLVEEAAVSRYLKFMGVAAREGCDVIMRGKALEQNPRGHYVSPSICVVKDASIESVRKSVYQQSEIFGPNVAITAVDDIDQAIALANATQYGLVASVFTANRDHYLKFLEDLEVGILNWNKSTVGASSKLPFGGFKKSGNFAPTAVTASLYCTHPVSSLEVSQPQLDPTGFPGLNWN